jgi:hypothetical protein
MTKRTLVGLGLASVIALAACGRTAASKSTTPSAEATDVTHLQQAGTDLNGVAHPATVPSSSGAAPGDKQDPANTGGAVAGGAAPATGN